MHPLDIIKKYYQEGSLSYNILVEHSQMVVKKSLEIAANIPELNPDLKFLEEAAMLHDIGIFLTKSAKIDCHGDYPYICHGYLGRELLEKEGLPKHAMVCETHVGAGITLQDIKAQGLPLPKRDMLPKTVEEKIICLADSFYSKHPGHLQDEATLAEIRDEAKGYGQPSLDRFNELVRFLKVEDK